MKSPLSILPKKHDRSFLLWAAGLGALSRVVPQWSERIANDLWSRPMRTGGSLEVPGTDVHPFRVEGRSGRLRVWDYGGIGPTILLVHGWSGSASQMTGFVGPLRRAGYNPVAFDLPAHGQSQGQRTNLIEMSQAIAEVARVVKPVHGIVAHSLGATATALAHAGGLAAKRIVLIAPPAEVPYYIRAFAQGLGMSPARANGMLEKLRERFGELDAFDLRRVVRVLSTPALVMHAREDREVPFEHGAAIARAWPGARLEVLTKEGLSGRSTQHRWPLRDPQVVEQVVSFLAPDPFDIKGPARAA